VVLRPRHDRAAGRPGRRLLPRAARPRARRLRRLHRRTDPAGGDAGTAARRVEHPGAAGRHGRRRRHPDRLAHAVLRRRDRARDQPRALWGEGQYRHRELRGRRQHGARGGLGAGVQRPRAGQRRAACRTLRLSRAVRRQRHGAEAAWPPRDRSRASAGGTDHRRGSRPSPHRRHRPDRPLGATGDAAHRHAPRGASSRSAVPAS
jgi:hypothetical protein